MIEIASTLNIPKVMLKDYIDTLRADLTYYNPFNPDEFIVGYLETKDTIQVPRGVTLSNYGINIKHFKDSTVYSDIDFNTTPEFKLRENQVEAEKDILEAISSSKVYNNNILLTAPTGSGKTILLASVLAKLKQRVLFLSHLSMLSDQVYKELSENTTATIKILNSKDTEFADVNIATFQLLNSNPELLDRLSDSISIVVVDETENLVSPTRLAVFYKLKANILIFVSATPSRELVKRTGLIENFITHKVTMSSLHQVNVKFCMLDYRHLYWDSPVNQMMYKSSLFSFLKTNKILDDIISYIITLQEYEGTIWIIASLDKIHQYLTERLVSKGITCKSIQGTTSKRERNKVLDEISNGQLKVIISSAPISAGISIPELSVAIRLEPHSSSDELLEQQIGRLKRYTSFKDRQSPLWIDLAISGSLEYKGKQRFKLYQQRDGCKLIQKDKFYEYCKETLGKT